MYKKFMWNYIALSSPPLSPPSPPLRLPRYTVCDAFAYVLTLCSAATVISIAKTITVQRWLGTQWVLGWFALDAVWNPTSTQQRFQSFAQYLAFLVGLVVHIALLYNVNRISLDYVNIVIVAASVIFWCVVEERHSDNVRTSAKITSLYAAAAVIALVSGVIFDFKVEPPSWFYYFVALQYSGVPHQDVYLCLSKFLHGWIWAVLVYDLATDQLDFSVWF